MFKPPLFALVPWAISRWTGKVFFLLSQLATTWAIDQPSAAQQPHAPALTAGSRHAAGGAGAGACNVGRCVCLLRMARHQHSTRAGRYDWTAGRRIREQGSCAGAG